MKLLSCGSGGSGLLLLSSLSDYSSPTESSPQLQTLFLGGMFAIGLSSRELLYWGENCPIPRSLASLKVNSIACGWTHALVLSQGKVFALGEGRQGQLGLGDTQTVTSLTEIRGNWRPRDVACGFRTSFIVTEPEQLLYCFGDNKKYQLGLPQRSCYDTPTLSPITPGVQLVASGHRHSVALINGLIHAWGHNDFGQFGVPTPAESQEPVAVAFSGAVAQVCCGWFHTVVVTQSGDLYMTGKGDLGAQGTGEWTHCKEFHRVATAVTSVATGCEHVIAVSAGTAYSWGWNEHGNLGLGDRVSRAVPSPVPLPAVQRVFASSAVSFFLVAE